MIRSIVLTAWFIALPLALWPSDNPALAESLPATTQTSLDQLLDGLDARGKNLDTLVANVAKTETDTSLGEDGETRLGRIVYQRRGDADMRIRASFDKVKIGEKVKEDRVEYLLSDGKLTDRSYRSRVEIKRIVQKPGQKLDLFKLGQGPFPLPIGQPKEAVYEQFDVTEVAGDKADPPNTAHIKLIPKPETELSRKFSSLDVWVDRTDHLPRRIETLNPQRTVLTKTELSDVKINEALKDSDFTLEPVKDWTIREEAD